MWHFGGRAQPPPWEEQRAFGEMLKATCGKGKERRGDWQGQSDGAVVSLPHRDGSASCVQG